MSNSAAKTLNSSHSHWHTQKSKALLINSRGKNSNGSLHRENAFTRYQQHHKNTNFARKLHAESKQLNNKKFGINPNLFATTKRDLKRWILRQPIPRAQNHTRQRDPLTTRRIKKTNHSHDDYIIKNQVTIRPIKGSERNWVKLETLRRRHDQTLTL